jgi:hypothetical protein
MNQDIVSQLRDFGLEEEVDYSLPTAHFDAGGDAGGDGGGMGFDYGMPAYDPEAEAREAARLKKEHEEFLASPAGKVYNQILSQGTTGKWSGEGFGGAEANAKEMARMLSKAGITDIRDFGRIEKTTYSQMPVQAEIGYTTNGMGEAAEVTAAPTGRYYTQDPETGARTFVDASQVKTSERSEGSAYSYDDPIRTYTSYYTEVPQTTTVFGNKKTGQEVDPNYNRAGGDVFGGTYTGKGRTNFGVHFAPDGTPVFYTQYGGSTSTFKDIAPIVGIGLALFAPGIGGAIGSALTGTAATSIASQVIGSAIVQGAMTEMSGGDFIDGAIRGAVTAGAAPIVSQTIGSSVASAMGDSVFKNLVTNSVTSAATNAVVAGFTGGDISDAALSGALSGAAGSIGQELGVSTEYGTDPFTKQNQMLMSQERGMGLSGDIGRIAGRTGASILMGADPTQAILSGLIRASEVDDLSRPDTPEQEQVRSEETFTFSYPDFSHFGFNNINLDDAGLMGPFGPFENQAPLLLAQETPSFESIFNYPSTQTAGLSDGSNASDLEIIDSLTKEKPTEIGTNVITAPDGSQLVYDQDNNLIDVIAPSDETSELDVDKSLTSDVTAADLNFPSQLEQKEDGTYQLTNDDGSTITIDNAGNIVNVTPEDIVTTPSVVDTTDNKPAEDTVTGGTVVDTVTGGQVNDAVTEQDFNVVAAPDGSQLVFDQDNNLVDIIEPEQAPATEADTDLTSTPGQDFNIITADDGSQLILDQNNNIVNVIDANDSVAKDTEISEIDYGAGTEKPTDFQGPMGPMTEDQVKRYNDEFAKYLDFLQAGEPPPPDYGVQDLGITDENWNSFNQNLLQMQEEGRLPTQWAPNEDGTFTFTSDDGSSITINDSGEITHYTDAPEGNLLTDIVTTTPATSTSGGGASGGGGGGGGGGGTSTKSGSGLNFGSLFSALGGLGALGGAGGVGSRAVSKPAYATDIPEFNATKMFSPTLYAERQKYAKKPPLDENQEKQETRYPW